MPTIILRHKKENLKKCSLKGLEDRKDMQFFTYPKQKVFDLTQYVVLDVDAPMLSKKDADKGIFLIDGTWNYAMQMKKHVFNAQNVQRRCLPATNLTAYPRKQTGCTLPNEGLASVEALYLAYLILGRDTSHLLDHYYWKDAFLENVAKELLDRSKIAQMQ